MPVPIWVALIGGAFTVLVALIQKMAKENKRDHGQVVWLLQRIERKLDKHVGDKNAHT
jgi:hypothetical protein